MPVQQQAGQLTKQRLMGHQHLDLCTFIKLIDHPLRIGVRGQPVDRYQRAIKSGDLHHQLRGFLSPPVRADQHPLHACATQLLGALANLTDAALGQPTLRITGSMRFCLAVTQ